MTAVIDITPGSYIRLRREAQGIALPAAARAYAAGSCDLPTAERLLEEAEGDLVRLGEPGLRRLQTAFRFDVSIYLGLVEGGFPVPDICRGCGCTWSDACVGGCWWADSARTICSACSGAGA